MIKKASLRLAFFAVILLCEASPAGAAAAGASAVAMHFFELCILFGGKHRFVGVVAFGQERLHLFSFFLRQEVFILVDGFYLATEIFLAGFEFGDLVIGEVQV